ncbi:MAG: linear amide C-N hydrolase, partial [Bacteroidales bacterium]|nr:linear amide C-N hydrolase [Bacteroidales bacterium]
SWALASCAPVDEVIEAAGKIDVTGLSGSIGAVHWRLADRTGRQVILEITDGEMHFFENPVGVLTNSPGFQWHLTNLSNYVNLIPGSAGNKTWTSGDGIYEVKPVSGGSGMLGLPGDYTSPSRFVRIAMFRATAPVPPTAYDAMLQSFKILEAMVIPIGAVVDVNENSEKTLDMITSTQFTTVSDIDNLKFYYRTMDNSMIRCIDFNTIDFRKVKYVSRPLDNVPEQVQMVAVK